MFADQSPNGHPHGAGKRWHYEALSGSKRPSRDGEGSLGRDEGEDIYASLRRMMAERRRWLVEAITPEHIRQISEALLRKAEAGNVQAMKLLLQYRLGTPAAARGMGTGVESRMVPEEVVRELLVEATKAAFQVWETVVEALQGRAVKAGK